MDVLNFKSFIPVAVITLFISSCRPAGEGSDKTGNEDSVSQVLPAAPVVSGVEGIEGCYRMEKNGDTAGIRLVVNGSKVDGELYFHWKEKDHNDGTITGTISDSVILAQYTFMSEGLRSVREVIFNIKGDSLYPGYGNVVERGDTVKFQDRSSIRYDRSTRFVRVQCSN